MLCEKHEKIYFMCDKDEETFNFFTPLRVLVESFCENLQFSKFSFLRQNFTKFPQHKVPMLWKILHMFYYENMLFRKNFWYFTMNFRLLHTFWKYLSIILSFEAFEKLRFQEKLRNVFVISDKVWVFLLQILNENVSKTCGVVQDIAKTHLSP